MAILDLFKGKKKVSDAVTFPAMLGSVSNGTYVPMSEIPDDIFSSGTLGICCGIEPSEGKVYAPISGTIGAIADSLHAVGMESAEMELMIHVGIDTVEMNGDGFNVVVKNGQHVNKGDLLLTMDLEKIKAADHPSTIIMAVTNSDAFAEVKAVGSGDVLAGDDVLEVCK